MSLHSTIQSQSFSFLLSSLLWTHSFSSLLSSLFYRLILAYLIPVKLLRGILPSSQLLNSFPRLASLYSPLLLGAKKGDVRAYDQALADPVRERSLVKLGTYLALEKAREACLRGLFRKVWEARDKSTRIEIEVFRSALMYVGVQLGKEEAEWLIATTIFKGYLKGYISHERGVVVLAAKDPFPRLGTFVVPS